MGDDGKTTRERGWVEGAEGGGVLNSKAKVPLKKKKKVVVVTPPPPYFCQSIFGKTSLFFYCTGNPNTSRGNGQDQRPPKIEAGFNTIGGRSNSTYGGSTG